jgi:serine/threonine protein phosphatase PrpC
MIAAHADTDTGLRRSGNEDSFLMQPERGLFAVADGLGGLSYGEVASRMAVEFLGAQEMGAFDDLTALVRTASGIIRRKGIELGGGTIGTTLTLAIVDGGYLRIAQVGDSVAFLTLPDGKGMQLTREHTVAEERRSAGRDDVEPYMEHVLTQCLGQEDEVVPDVFMREFPAGARLLLCSDGITKTVDRAAILESLRTSATPKVLVDGLIQAANANGGPDNSTAVAVFRAVCV